MRSAQRVRALRRWLRWGLSSGMDIAAWLGAEVRVGQKDKVLPERVQDALAKAWEENVLEEDDIPEDGTTLDEVQLDEDLKILLRAFGDGVKLLKAEKFGTDEEKLTSWFRARFSNQSTVLLAGTASNEGHHDQRVPRRYGSARYERSLGTVRARTRPAVR